MPLTRHRQRLTDQNASQPIHRLGPELLSEIFLQARPNVFTEPEPETNAWAKLVRYLVNITSVSCCFRQIALDFGGLWTVVGFSLQTSEREHCRSALNAMEAFLERAQKRKLHFYFDYPSPRPPPERFHSDLFTLIEPHSGRVQTLYYHLYPNHSRDWEHLRTLLSGMGNVNNLTVHFPSWVGVVPFSYEPISLPHLRELSLTNVPHSVFSLEQVESLELQNSQYQGIGIQRWLYKLSKLKRLVLCGIPYLSLNTKFLLENLTHLQTNIRIYSDIAPWLSLPQHRHLVVDMDSSLPITASLPQQQLCPHPSVRTLSIAFTARTGDHLQSAIWFVVKNPQLEYLEFKCMRYGFPLLKLLSGVFSPIERGTRSLKYLRLRFVAGFGTTDKALLTRRLTVILSRHPELRLDLVRPARELAFLRKLVDRFPSRVRSYLEPYQGIPLDKLYDELPRDSESE